MLRTLNPLASARSSLGVALRNLRQAGRSRDPVAIGAAEASVQAAHAAVDAAWEARERSRVRLVPGSIRTMRDFAGAHPELCEEALP